MKKDLTTAFTLLSNPTQNLDSSSQALSSGSGSTSSVSVPLCPLLLASRQFPIFTLDFPSHHSKFCIQHAELTYFKMPSPIYPVYSDLNMYQQDGGGKIIRIHVRNVYIIHMSKHTYTYAGIILTLKNYSFLFHKHIGIFFSTRRR